MEVVVFFDTGDMAKLLNPRVIITNMKCNSYISSLVYLTKKIRVNKPDIIISNKEAVNITSLIAHSLSRSNSKLLLIVNTNLTQHFNFEKNLRRTVIKLLTKLLFPFAKNIIGVSASVAADIHNYSKKENIKGFIYNPVISKKQIRDIMPKPKEFSSSNSKNILFIGRINPSKNIPFLLKSFQKALNKNNNLILNIIGTGPSSEVSKITQLIKDLQLSNNVVLLGYKDNVFEYLAHADLLVSPSLLEGFSNTIAEALSMGCPVISSSKTSGPPEILDNGKYGILINNFNEDDYGKAIINVLNSSVDKNLLKQRGSVFTIENIGPQYIALFKLLV